MKSNIYFEPPSRLQLLDKLKHLVRFSDFLLLVSGDTGAGKSTLLAQLLPEKSDTTLFCCLVKPEAELSPQQLLQSLIVQLPAHESADSFSDQVKVLHQQLQSMSATGQKCLILVDDAEFLSDEAFQLVMNLHAAGAQVLLVAEPSYVDRVLATNVVKSMEGRVHHVEISGMTVAEADEYLQICHPALASLPEKKKAELIELSEGMPGRIERLLAGGKIASKAPAKSAFPLPPVHMLGIGVVLAGILGVSLWQFMPEEPEVESVVAVEDRVSVPLIVPATDVEASQLPVEPETADQVAVDKPVLVARQSLSDRLKAQEEKLKPQMQSDSKPAVEPKTADTTELSPAVSTESVDPVTENKAAQAEVVKVEAPAQAVSKPMPASELESDLRKVVEGKTELKPTLSVDPEVKPAATAIAPKVKEPVIVQKESVKPTKVGLSVNEQSLLTWADKGYTLQMLGARSKDSAIGFIKAQVNPNEFYYFSTNYKGKPWHVVVYGQYTNRDIANAAIRKLPKKLQNLKPWARSIQGVKIDIRNKK